MSRLPTRKTALAAALGWSGLCLVVLAGLPAWLVSTWGWPPPTLGLGVRLGGFPAHPGPGAGVGVVDVAVWAAWVGVAWFAAAVVVEAAQAAGERMPRRLVGLGPAQVLAARAIGAILLLRALSGAPAGPAPAAPAGLVLDHHLPVPASEHPVVDAQPAAPEAAAPECATATSPVPRATGTEFDVQGPSYVVVRGDTLWGIAADQLGDPLRWPEIAALNYGRPQPDGRALTSAHWIFSGWVLLLPSPQGISPTPPAVVLGGQLPPVAPSPPRAAPEPEAQPHPATVGGYAPDPEAGQAPASVPGQGTVRTQQRAGQAGHHLPGPVEATLAAAGVVAVVEALRRVQQRHRRRGRRIRLPAAQAAAGETRLRAMADPDTVARIDAALRGLGAALGDSVDAVPIPSLLAVGDDVSELMVGPGAGEPPAGVVSWPGSWLVDGSLPNSDAGVGQPWPALVGIGVEADRRVLVNLEAAGTLALSGEPGVVEALLRAMATELATAPWAAAIDLVLVGFGEELRPAGRSRLAGSLDEVAVEARARRQEADRLLADGGHPNLPAARLVVGGDAWAPLVILSSLAPSDAEATALAEVAVAGGPVAVVASGLPGANWCLDLAGPEAVLDPLGVRVRPALLDAEAWCELGALLTVASDTRDVPAEPLADEPSAAAAPASRSLGEPEAAAALQPDAVEIDLRDEDTGGPAVDADEVVNPPAPEVEVQVIGPVNLVGHAVEPERPKYTEVVTRMAMAERPLSTDELVTDVWAGAAARSTVDSAVSKAREILGTRPDGTPRLARAQGWGERALHESVRTDWWRFRFLAAQRSTPALRMALELVRGRPFEGFKADWADRIYVPTMESEIIDAAEELARRALDAGDPAAARWAARRGLRAAQYDERLWRPLMRAAHAEGGVAAMEAVFDECARVVEAEMEPFDSLQPETVELYLHLGGRRRGAQRADPARVG